MANLCENYFRAEGSDENLKCVREFLSRWDASVEWDENTIEAWFESVDHFPDTEMYDLFDSLPDKDHIKMRCLSVEYEDDYAALWKCDENGWDQKV
jgi:hypothetical protein